MHGKATKTESAYVLMSWFLVWNKAVEFILTFIEKRLNLKQRQIISLDSRKFTRKEVDFWSWCGNASHIILLVLATQVVRYLYRNFFAVHSLIFYFLSSLKRNKKCCFTFQWVHHFHQFHVFMRNT